VNDVGSNGCPDTAYKTIYTYPLPNQPVIIQGTDSLCFGSTARFSIGNVQSNVKYLWGNDFNASGSRGANDSIYDVVMGTSSAQSVYVTATTTNYAHACSLKTPKPVTVKSYTSTSVVIDKLPSSINGQYILVCGSVDTSLTYQWGYSLGGTENLIANATSQSYIVDSSKAGANFYVIITDAQGCKSKEYYNKNNILSIADIMGLNTEVMVSPNPTTTAYHLRINSERVQNWNIQITDIAGRSVHNERLTGDKSNLWKIEASGWASGTYYLRVQSQSGDFATLTLIKE
jgi:hypothetical protein